MKKILFAISMLALALSALPQAKGADISIDFIYDNLSGGNWIDVGGYGYGWQPDTAVSDPNWRPYTDGYWAYTDYGWTWISYEDFGWATYHYGRWANLADYGWVWFPGSDLEWGPAWVSWRTGGDYIGWAPLPPRGPGVVYESQPIGTHVDVEFDIGPQYYNFCDVRFIGEPVLRDRIFPPAQNVTYITNTVNVTNIYVQNNTVYNYGPDYHTVSAYSARPIQRLSIERQPATDVSAALKSGQLTKVQGNKLLVAAPSRIAPAPASVKPRALKATVAQPKVEHGWNGISNRAELEQKIKAENPKNVPPPSHAAERKPGNVPPAAGMTPAGEGQPGAAVPPGARGKAGRMPPGEIGTTPATRSPAPFERGKGRTGRMPPGATQEVPGAPEAGSPAPFERGKDRAGRMPPGMAPGPAQGESVPPFEGGKGRGRSGLQPGLTPGEQPTGVSPAPFEGGNRRGQRGGPSQPETIGGPPGREAEPLHGKNRGTGTENMGVPPTSGVPANERRAPGRQLPPGGGAENATGAEEQRVPPGLRHPPVNAPSGPAPGEARGGARERGQGAYAQPGGGAPGGVERPQPHEPPQAQGQPQGQGQAQGQPQQQHAPRKGEKGSPPPQ